jgi:hypothetical protein
MGLVWGYFRRELNFAIADLDDDSLQAGIHRIYHSILSFAGLVVSFLGLLLLLGTIIESLFNLAIGNNAASLSDTLALLLIGLPLWMIYWKQIQLETARSDERGAAARTSLLRKAYLYLALFATVVGTMLSTGWWIYGVLKALLDQMPSDFWLNFNLQLRIAILFAIFLVYHLRILRTDNRFSPVSKMDEQPKNPVLVFQSGDFPLGEEIINDVQQKYPHLTVILDPLIMDIPHNKLDEASLIVIPDSVALNFSEHMRYELQSFSGKVLVVPEKLENWHWLENTSKDQKHLVQQIVDAINQLSKNLPIQPTFRFSPWVMAAFVLAGLFLLQISAVVIGTIINIVFY